MAEMVRFQHFELSRREDGSLHELGRGAMGITYKAFDTNLRCDVALKVINSAYLNSETAQQRFLREARAAAALRHPNVATVFHLGREGDDYFYAMEFVDGETVEAYIKREGAFPVLMALKIAAQVARALSAAQKQGLVHRDIKPSNIMYVREDGGDFTVKVIDFGLAKNSRAESEDSATLTAGGFLGTPHFASPEQLEERETDGRADIYSLGVTLWYMLQGDTPFSGSTAQVMSQHLNREPPFQDLHGQSPSVINLLRRMMAKNPSDRPQTPTQLRQEIEKIIEEIEDREPAALSPALEPPSLPSESPQESTASGAVLAGRFRLHNEVTASDHGRMFRAERLEDGTIVAILIVHSSLIGKSETFTRLEQEVHSLQRLNSPAFQRILSLETTGSSTFLVLEWVEGLVLLDLLRSRRALPGSEARLLLLPLADAFDELRAANLMCPDIGAHEVFLPGADIVRSVSQWSSCQPKFLPLTTAGASSASPDATMVASSFALMRAKGAFTSDPSGAYVYAVAALAYEMLGGVKAEGSSATYVPTPGLSEEGNAVLRRALTIGHHYESARAFVESIPEEDVTTTQPAAPRASVPKPPPLPVEKPRTMSWGWLWTVVAILLVIGGIVLWQGVRFAQRLRIAQAPSIEAVSPTPEPQATATPLLASTPAPSPVATPVPTPSLAPTPSPYEQAVAVAEELRLKDDVAGALVAYADIATNFPDEEQPRNVLEMMAANLRARAAKLSSSELASLREPLEKAAALDVVSAQMLLGEILRQSDPGDSLKWLIAAGNRGQTEAMVTVGQMLASGRGVQAPDLTEAAVWFSKAAEHGDPAGMYVLAECHLFGKGVPKDPRRAVELLTAASALNNPRAMNLLGDIYRKGVPGVTEPNFSESVKLFSRSQELGFLDAQGNLGVLYIYGQGVPKDERKAFELFQDGAEKGNPLCMFFSAMCFEGGVGVEVDRKAARTWYVRAAQGGNRTAIEWCKKNNIPLASHP
jgi:serine/threonine protein kinase/TPR repeat protein